MDNPETHKAKTNKATKTKKYTTEK